MANGLSVLLLHEHSNHNLNMKSAYLHLLTDTLASVAVLIGGLMMKYFQLYWVDSVMTLIIAIYLLVVGYDLLKSSAKMLMLFTPEGIEIDAISKEVHQIPGVKRLHHIHVWNLNDEELHLEAHLDCTDDITITRFTEIQLQIETLLHDKFGISHVTIQPEFNRQDEKDFIVED